MAGTVEKSAMRSEGKKIGGCLRIRKLSTGMIMVILTCLIIPYFVLSGILITVYTRRNNRQVEQTVTSSYENGGALVVPEMLPPMHGDISRIKLPWDK